MTFSFDDEKYLPQPGEIVYCLWGGAEARPVLVYASEQRINTRTNDRFWAIWVFYGTSVFPPRLDLGKYLIIAGGEIKKCGLDKRTRFDVSRRGIDWYPWTAEFFVPKPYVLSDGDPYQGTISTEDIEIMDLLYFRSCQSDE